MQRLLDMKQREVEAARQQSAAAEAAAESLRAELGALKVPLYPGNFFWASFKP